MKNGSGRRNAGLRIGVCACFWASLVCVLIASVSRVRIVYSTGGAYSLTEHGGTDVNSNTVTGVTRPAATPAGYTTISTTDYPAGTCIHCHDEHSSLDGVTHTTMDYLSFDPGGADKNRFCYTCHTNPLAVGGNYTADRRVWMGSAIYNTSGHGTSASMVWPGTNPPARTAAEAGKCINCHDPHGTTYSIAAGSGDSRIGQVTYQLTDAILQMTTRVEENLCLNCHKAGGPANASNIASLLALANNASPTYYNHPVSRNTAVNDRTPSYHNVLESQNMYTTHMAGPPQQTGRHVECVDCHNPHYSGAGGGAGADAHTLGSNVASKVMYGSWGVRTAGDPTVKASWPSGAALGTLNAAPAFNLNYIDNTGTDYEWELCIKCHSSYSQYPVFAAPNALTDISREMNPNNLAHHALTRPGNNQLTGAAANIKATYDGSFTIANPRNATIYCSDCHTSAMNSSDTAATRVEGPHGSSNAWLLGSWCESRGGTDFGTANCADAMQTAVCYKCHKFGVYYNGAYLLGSYGSRAGVHDNTHRVVNVWGASLWCLNCHGGGVDGGIHGTNAAIGPKGAPADPSGYHFMNGACLASYDYGTGGTNNMACWTKAAVDTYCTSTCAGQHTTAGGKTSAPKYDYCEPACPGT